MEKKMLIALALSLAVLFVFQGLTAKKKQQIQAPLPAPDAAVQLPAQTGDRQLPAPSRIKQEAPLQENETEILTDKYRLVFSDVGGTLKKLYLEGDRENGTEELIMSEDDVSKRPFAMRSAFLAGLENRQYSIMERQNVLEYRLIEPGWVEITKRYEFHKALNYIDLGVKIKNLSSRKIDFSYQMTGPSGLLRTTRIAGRSFLESDIMIDGKVWKAKSVKGAQEKTGHISWLAQKNRYFAMVLKPFKMPGSVTMTQAADKKLVTALNSSVYKLAPGEAVEDAYLLYAGPLDEARIAAMGYDMQAVVDYGFFGGVSKALLSILRFFHGVTHNWGVAIILLTLTTNLLLFPLTFKSFASMQKMKNIQPHLQKLKELHKDNPQKLNKEMMGLYKQYNVNPLGGCLPLLLQMPIFISLYQGLMRSFELKGASFLWIKDLAKPDAVPLPFSAPVIGASINILPLLMVGVMALQQKISQGATAGAMAGDQASQQKMMMVMMPLFFGFLFYKMPSGLVLYWLTNTILTTSEQTLIGKRMSRS